MLAKVKKKNPYFHDNLNLQKKVSVIKEAEQNKHSKAHKGFPPPPPTHTREKLGNLLGRLQPCALPCLQSSPTKHTFWASVTNNEQSSKHSKIGHLSPIAAQKVAARCDVPGRGKQTGKRHTHASSCGDRARPPHSFPPLSQACFPLS